MMELLISWCVTSSILLAVFLLLRGTVFRKLSPRVRYALWGVVLLRLLVPFQIPSLSLPAAAADLVPKPPVLSNRPLSPDTAMGHAVIPSDLLEENGLTIADGGTVQASPSGQDAALWELQENGEVYLYFGGPTLDDVLRAAIVLVWSAGTGVVLLAVLAANLRFAQKLRRSRRPLPTAGCPLPVYEADGLSSPCLCGVLRPAVYLTPEAAEDGTVRTHVLSHELTHFRHRDHIWSLLRCPALALHWYNPLVWAAVILSKRDGELACDEGTIRQLGEGERIPYGRTLIGLVARRSGAGGLLSCSTTMTGGKKTVQRRIAQLVKQPETKKTALFLAAAAVALAAVFVFAGGNSEPSFAQQLQAAHTIQVTFDSAYNDYDAPRITDSDLVAQAKTILLSGNPDNHTVAPGLRYTNTSVEFFNEAGRSLGFHFLSNQSMCTSLYELAREQESRQYVAYQVESPEGIAALSQLFLSDPACVEQNASPDYDMADWLTNWTNLYEVSYGVPWWDPEAPVGWYARAMDAGSWYTIAIPDHLADAVLEVCREAALCPSSEELYAALQGESPVCFTPSPTADFFYRISDRDVIAQISSLLLDEAVTSTDRSRSPGRVATGEADCIVSFARDGDTELHVYLEERDGGCLLACGPLGEDNEENASFPVLRVLPSGTSTAIRQAVDDWYARQPQSDSAPAD